MTATVQADEPVQERPKAQQLSMRLVDGCDSHRGMIRVLVVGSEQTFQLTTRILAGSSAKITAVESLREAECWLTGCHADLVLADAWALGDPMVERLCGLRTSPLCASTLLLIVGEGEEFRTHQCVPKCRAHLFSYDDEERLRSFVECRLIAHNAIRSLFALGGSLPSGGIRSILPILESERRSGRLVVQPRDESRDQITLWVRDGEPLAAYSEGMRLDEPLKLIGDVFDGWFGFIETAVDRDMLMRLDAWSDQVSGKNVGVQTDREAGGLRQRLRVALMTARTIGEMREAVESLLDAGIDRAAEDGDTSQMDRLADVSILLQKNQIEEAFKLLTVMLR
jgi:hypothetical protein